jgi:hypothetical protein
MSEPTEAPHPRAAYRDELLAMAAADYALRDTLARSGALFGTYHPDMAALHRANAERLRTLLDVHGWPTPARDGGDAVDAAWLVVQHAIGEPDFQRRMLRLLRREAGDGHVAPALVAMLEDRVHTLEGKPQRYGTQLDWNAEGELAPIEPIEDPATIDTRRASVGLGPLGAYVARLRARATAEGEHPPADHGAYRARAAEWARAVGWRR